MEKKNFHTTITVEASAGEAIKKISNIPEWWGITFTGRSEKQNDKFTVKLKNESPPILTTNLSF